MLLTIVPATNALLFIHSSVTNPWGLIDYNTAHA